MKQYCVDYTSNPTFYDNDYERGCRTVEAESAQEAVDTVAKSPPPQLFGFEIVGVRQVVGDWAPVRYGKVVAK